MTKLDKREVELKYGKIEAETKMLMQRKRCEILK